MSLVEVMVTIAIVVTVSSVLLMGVMHIWEQAKVQQSKVQLGQVGQDVTVYLLRTQRKVPPGHDLGFLEGDVPRDAWDSPIELRVPGPDGAPWGLVSLGRDGEEGGEDLDEDIVWTPAG
jgi:general secretion pathway protein G